MKGILKTVLGLAVASVAATAVLSFSVFASADGANDRDDEGKMIYSNGMWHATFPNKNVAAFDKEFYEPNSFRFHVDGNYLTLTGELPYARNYKSAVITLNSECGIMSESTPYENHNNLKTTVSADYSGSIHHGQYFGFMYDGKDIDDGMFEKATVYVSSTDNMPLSVTNSVE